MPPHGLPRRITRPHPPCRPYGTRQIHNPAPRHGVHGHLPSRPELPLGRGSPRIPHGRRQADSGAHVRGRQGISLRRRHSRRHALRPRCHHDWRDPLARGRSRCARRRADRPRRVDHSARGRRLRYSPPPHGHAHVSRRSRSQGNPLRAGRLRGTHLPAPHVPELPPLQPAALLPYRGSTAQPPSRRT